MPRMTKIIITDTELPKIDPKSVPQSDYDRACKLLYACIKRALADPVLRADYEMWKAKRRMENGVRMENGQTE